jgi:hypothetical protein
MIDSPRRFRKATSMSIEDYDELAQEFAEFGYRETSDPTDADRRNFYKVEKWDAAELHVEALIHAFNDLECARAIFASEKNRRPRGRYTLRQGLRVLEGQMRAAIATKASGPFFATLRTASKP